MGGGVLGPRLRRDAAPRELHEDLGGGVEEAREPRRRARHAAVALVAVASVVAVERRFVYGVGLSAKEPSAYAAGARTPAAAASSAPRAAPR